MSGMGDGSKFTSTTKGHVHLDTPKVFYGPIPPEAANRGDVWVQTA
jgi:hypothetical protein